jgi:adenosine deaminase
MHVYVEANPSSNLKISYVNKYCDLPFLQISQYPPKISVSLNTDDSSLFQTSLVNEYAMVAAALFRESENGQIEMSEEEIYDYIEELVKNSNYHNFVDYD